MIFDTFKAVKAIIEGVNPMQDALKRNCVVRWGQADPRKTVTGKPSDLKYESQTNVSIELINDSDNSALMRFPVEIQDLINLNGRASYVTNPHPEARLLQLMISIRSEGRAADANVMVVRSALAKRLKHKSHLAVTTDIYRDGRQFTIKGLVLLSTATLNKPDGVVRRAFSYDLVYLIESWILFPDERRDVAAAAEINLEFRDLETEDLLATASHPSE